MFSLAHGSDACYLTVVVKSVEALFMLDLGFEKGLKACYSSPKEVEDSQVRDCAVRESIIIQILKKEDL